MRYLRKALFTTLLLLAWASHAEVQSEITLPATCDEPGLLALPEGNKASSEEMLKAQGDVNDYVERTKLFLKCLLANEKHIGDALTYEQKKASITKYNLAVARMQRLVEQYNRQLSVYQQLHSDQS